MEWTGKDNKEGFGLSSTLAKHGCFGHVWTQAWAAMFRYVTINNFNFLICKICVTVYIS